VTRSFLAPPGRPPLGPRERPAFSVVIAAYQAADVVGAAIESALSQTVAPHEIVVCDDGSTDGTADAVARYGDSVTYVWQENGGEAAAKNAGARAASGEFVAILDADDVYLPDRLDALGELASARPDLDILVTDAYLELGGELVRRCYGPTWPFVSDDQRLAIVQRNFILGHAAVRRERLLDAGGFDEALRFVTDWDLWARLILSGSQAGLVDEPLARYRVSPGSLSSQRVGMQTGKIAVLEKILRRTDLQEHERSAAVAALARERRDLPMVEAREALRAGRPDARQRALAVALGPSQSIGSRAKGLAAALAPRAAGAILRGRGSEATAGILLAPPARARRAGRRAGDIRG
jgi:hypothetical protein